VRGRGLVEGHYNGSRGRFYKPTQPENQVKTDRLPISAPQGERKRRVPIRLITAPVQTVFTREDMYQPLGVIISGRTDAK